jgi:glutamine cyclotransferase
MKQDEQQPRQVTQIIWMATTAVLFVFYIIIGGFFVRINDSTALTTQQERSIIRLGHQVTVLQTIPHDPNAWTQGLVASSDGLTLYEGTGLYGESNLRKIDVTTGQIVQQSTTLPEQYFGEGIALYTDENNNSRIIQLTWKEKTGFIYNRDTLTQVSSFSFSTKRNQGWGITVRKNTFIVSDGSRVLHIWDQSTLQEIKRVRVGQFFPFPIAVPLLNELEYDPISDTLLANVLGTKRIVRIDPETGRVLAQYNLRPLYTKLTEQYSNVGALNGIALVPGTEDQYWVTGKWWPEMYKVEMPFRRNRN